MLKYLLILITLVLTGCASAPKEIIVTEVQTVYRRIPSQLLKKEPVPAPIEKTQYLSMDFLQKEIYLTDYVLNNMKALGNCNANMQAIIDYDKAQSEITK